jgi:DNA polymerase V
MLMDICSENAVQGNLFDTMDRQKQKKLMEVLDKINDYYGRNTLKFGIMGDGNKWKIKHERLSPGYTTRV